VQLQLQQRPSNTRIVGNRQCFVAYLLTAWYRQRRVDERYSWTAELFAFLCEVGCSRFNLKQTDRQTDGRTQTLRRRVYELRICIAGGIFIIVVL